MAETSQQHKIWLLRLVFSFRFGGWLSGALIFIVLYGLLKFLVGSHTVGFYSGIFLCALIAYMVPIYGHITRQSVLIFDQLSGLLRSEPAEITAWRQSLEYKSRPWILAMLVMGLAAGLGQSFLIEAQRSDITTHLSRGGLGFVYILTLLTWMTLTTAISALLDNARLFYRLGRDRLVIDLLATKALTPLSRVGVMSTLSLIGAQVLLVVLLMDAEADLLTVLPGLITLAAPMFPMLLLPVWSTHKRLKQAKWQELDTIQRQLNGIREDYAAPFSEPEKMAQLNRLLIYRREISQLSEWPIDIGALTRLGFYLVIPPLTWVGAALIENIVDSLV